MVQALANRNGRPRAGFSVERGISHTSTADCRGTVLALMGSTADGFEYATLDAFAQPYLP